MNIGIPYVELTVAIRQSKQVHQQHQCVWTFWEVLLGCRKSHSTRDWYLHTKNYKKLECQWSLGSSFYQSSKGFILYMHISANEYSLAL